MKLFIFLILGLIPSISFAQNLGDGCGVWNLPKCGPGLECTGGFFAADWPGTCTVKEKPKELPTWFGTEDRVAVNRKTNWFNTLISSECNKDREGQTWHGGEPYARICCLLSNNQYEEIAGNSCPNIQGRCGIGEMECAGPGPGTRCVPRGQCNPMRRPESSFAGWLTNAFTPAEPKKAVQRISIPKATTLLPCLAENDNAVVKPECATWTGKPNSVLRTNPNGSRYWTCEA